jgi:hypothetical protein
MEHTSEWSLGGADLDAAFSVRFQNDIDAPGPAAHRAVLDERTAGLRIHEQLHTLATVRTHHSGHIGAQSRHRPADQKPD